ncbi:hypothetical protein BJF90_38660 [Pseudonocardia sp. CNS-004]|nr:hypothetical protein BJF90_38660 [Pseudonocardia sp. CNS-004]
MAIMALATGVASGQEASTQLELPTVACSWSAVTLGIEQYCINVYGEGLYVDRVSGELEVVDSKPDPVEGAEVNLQGTLENGAPYDVTEVAPDGISSASAWFHPRTTFKDGSELCIRTKIGAVDYSDPTCVTIHS